MSEVPDTDVTKLLEAARTLEANTHRSGSKLEAHRAFILQAISEGLKITTIQTILEKRCNLKVSYANLHAWIHRQPEFRKTTQPTWRKPMTREQKAKLDEIANRDPNEPLTLIRK
jgi:hypothetical protein